VSTVLLTGSGGCVSLGGLTPLRAAGHKVVGLDADDEFSAGRYLCDEFRVMPRALRSKRVRDGILEVDPNPDFYAALERALDETGAEALLVNPDPEVLAVARWGRPLPLIMPSFAQIVTAHDKSRTHQILEAVGVPLARWVDAEPDFASACRDVLDSGRKLLGKEKAAAGGQNLQVIDSLDRALKLRDAFPDMLIFEYLPGAEYAVVLLYAHGEPYVELAFRKHEYKWGQGTRNRSHDEDELFELGDRAVRALAASTGEQPHGTYHVDTKRNADGKLHVLEINAGRAFGGTPDAYMAWAGGINLPDTILRLIRGERPARRRLAGGIIQLQFHDYVLVDGDRSRTWSSLRDSK
jgi:hypothetical protein